MARSRKSRDSRKSRPDKGAPTAADLNRLASILDYRPVNPDFFVQAITHSSYTNEVGQRAVADNERLEFLGDAVLGLVVADHLFVTHPDLPEGQLARSRANVVDEGALSAAARRIRLGELLLLGRGEERSGGRERPSILADALEAVIGALYRDGGLEAARRFILQTLGDDLDAALQEGSAAVDPKSSLQELVQGLHRETPVYELLDSRGPDHALEFTCRVLVRGREVAQGTGRSRRAAEREAAARALEVLRSEEKS